ncbi:MAG: TonB-dependent siderophore receptor [Rhodanobacter sp.]
MLRITPLVVALGAAFAIPTFAADVSVTSDAYTQTDADDDSDIAQRRSHRLNTPDSASSAAMATNVAMLRTDLGAAQDSASTRLLEEVQVYGMGQATSYRIGSGSTATGTQTALIDVPQSIQTIPAAVLRDQGAQSLGDAVRNAPGVSLRQGEGNRDEFYIRGVKTKSDFFTDGLRDDTLYYRDLYNVAQVDVLQGPAAILFGRGGGGGLINLVTKQPERETIRDLSIETGSWGHLRGTLDVGGALGELGAFRVLAMGEDSGGFRDHYYVQRHAINPKLRFQLSERTQLDLGVSYLNDHRFEDRGIPSRNGRPVDVSRNKFFGSVDQNLARSRVEAFNAKISHAVNDQVTVSNAFRVTDNDRLYVMAYPGSAVDDQDRVKLDAYARGTNRLSYFDRTELVARFETGALSHTLLVGSEMGWQRDNDRQVLPDKGKKKTLPGTYPLANPISLPVAMSKIDFDNHAVGKEFGVYVQDQISVGSHWKALVGIRRDRFSVSANYLKPGVTPNFTKNVDTEWSPRAGLIYKPVENNSIYASVTQTYTPNAFNIAVSQKKPDGAHLTPEKDTNYEIGNKLDLLDGRLSITAALFQLNLKDVVSSAADGSGRLVSTGAERNRGFALATEGALSSKLSVYANYTRLNAVITETTDDAEAGAHEGLVPRNQFSIWTRYALTPHWGFGAGLRGESAKYTSYTNEVVLPGYTQADLMAYYQADKYRVQVNVNNVTDKSYYSTANGDNEIMPATPRSVMLRLSMGF